MLRKFVLIISLKNFFLYKIIKPKITRKESGKNGPVIREGTIKKDNINIIDFSMLMLILRYEKNYR